MSSSKDRYRQFCSTERSLPIFMQHWWLDAVCGENWDVVLTESGEGITGALPFCIKKKFGFTLLRMPELTSFLGPYIKPVPGQKYVSQLSYEMEVLDQLVSQLPSFHLFRQRFHYNITNWLPFYWKGFKQTTRYSYIISLDNLTEVEANFKSSVRGKIRKASQLVEVHHDIPLQDFYTLLSKTFERQNLKPPVSFDYLNKVHEALSAHSSSKIFAAKGADGKLHSALYLIWDSQSAYVHMVGEDPELRNSGAGILLVWEAIQFTKFKLNLRSFDFLGSMLETVEPVRRSFGAKQVPYFQIMKVNSLPLKLAMAIGDKSHV